MKLVTTVLGFMCVDASGSSLISIKPASFVLSVHELAHEFITEAALRTNPDGSVESCGGFWGEEYVLLRFGRDEADAFCRTLRTIFLSYAPLSGPSSFLKVLQDFKTLQSDSLKEEMRIYLPLLDGSGAPSTELADIPMFGPYDTYMSAMQIIASEIERPSGTDKKERLATYMLSHSEALDDALLWIDEFCCLGRNDFPSLQCSVAVPNFTVLMALGEVTDSAEIREYLGKLEVHARKITSTWDLVDAERIVSDSIVDFVVGIGSEADIRVKVTDALELIKSAEEEMAYN